MYSKLSCCRIIFLIVSIAASLSCSSGNLFSIYDVSGFDSGSRHWWGINDEVRIINPLPGQQRYDVSQVKEIADNILLYQRNNGGWPKNFDMLAILTEEQKELIFSEKNNLNTTIDNGATHSQIEYLSKAFTIFKDEKYKEASLKGIDYLLSAQYPNGGWPQFFPEMKGYARYITFNDGAMIGVMKVLQNILNDKPFYSFVDKQIRDKIKVSFYKGLECILECRIEENGIYSVWCQQHDNKSLAPQNARTYELASICNGESSEIVFFLMSLDNPDAKIIGAIQDAIKWFESSRIYGIRIEWIDAPREEFIYHKSDKDKILVEDDDAPPIWPRFSELNTHRPLFCNRDGIPVYSMAEVERERRTGYGWYTYAPQEVLDHYPEWKRKWIKN